MKTIHGLLGPNGAGKSIIYHLMTGLIEQKKDIINGEDVTKFPVYLRTKQYGIGYVHNMWVADLTLYDNLRAISEINWK